MSPVASPGASSILLRPTPNEMQQQPISSHISLKRTPLSFELPGVYDKYWTNEKTHDKTVEDLDEEDVAQTKSEAPTGVLREVEE